MKRFQRGFLLCFVMMAVLGACKEKGAPSGEAGESLPPVLFTSAVRPEQATIGDVVTYTLRLSRSPDVSAELPEFRDAVQGLSPIDSGRTGPDRERGRLVETRWYTFRADRVGTSTFPPVKITYTLQGKKEEIRTGEVSVQVKSVLPRDMKDILDIKPLERPRRDMHLLFYVCAALLLVALLALAIGFHIRKKKRRGHAAVPPPILPPHTEAEEALQRLEAMGLIERGEVNRYYFILSEIFRRYLERRFQIHAVDRTSEEILEALPSLDIREEVSKEIRAFFRNTDPVKFAGRIPSRDEAGEETGRVREFIRRTFRETQVEEEEAEHVAV